MGKVQKFVDKKQKEKHTTTTELLKTINWYIQEMAKLDNECARAKRDLTDAYNARLAELKEKA